MARITPLGSTGSSPTTPYLLQVDGAVPSSLLPAELTTLARPAGRQLATFATANDVHFGEIECGRVGIAGGDRSDLLRRARARLPYPEVMNHAAIDEMIALASRRGRREGRPHRPRDRGGVRGVPAPRTGGSASGCTTSAATTTR